jgi:hypothetical protein
LRGVRELGHSGQILDQFAILRILDTVGSVAGQRTEEIEDSQVSRVRPEIFLGDTRSS